MLYIGVTGQGSRIPGLNGTGMELIIQHVKNLWLLKIRGAKYYTTVLILFPFRHVRNHHLLGTTSEDGVGMMESLSDFHSGRSSPGG